MKQVIGVLSVTLLIQLGLIALVYWPTGHATGPGPGEGLHDFNPDQVDEIHIGDEQDNEVVLVHAGGRWLLPELEDLPADASKVRDLLHGLAPSTPGWPVAGTAVARQRFQVADYHYQRRIILIGEGQLLGTLYLGTSPGFRKVHARGDGRKSVYSIEFSTHDAPAEAGAWLDRTLLQVRVPVSISSDLYDLRREGETWVSGWGQEPDERELQVLIDALRHLQVQGLAGEDTQRDLASASPGLSLHVNSLSGEQSLELFALDGRYFAHSERYATFFSISAYDFDRLRGLDAERLMGGTPEPPDQEADPVD